MRSVFFRLEFNDPEVSGGFQVVFLDTCERRVYVIYVYV